MSSLNNKFIEYIRKEEVSNSHLVNENYRPQHSKRRTNGKTGKKNKDYGIMKFKWLTVLVKYYLEPHGRKEKLLRDHGINCETFRLRNNRWMNAGMPLVSAADRYGNLIPIPGTEDGRGKCE